MLPRIEATNARSRVGIRPSLEAALPESTQTTDQGSNCLFVNGFDNSEKQRTDGRLPVSALDAHGNAVIELQSGDVAEPQHDAGSVRPAHTFSQLLERFPALRKKCVLKRSPKPPLPGLKGSGV
ncbi:hypothetical protein EYF80_049363 [Liparis tanakae]|uniref:Uncharacterized protein n=1 Tax=Liparis tanakae TaxID=230148 RepID=A0A4Z2FI66_9TELE|nr:hypothetical protein EYF80_049363 [Liparis tanakae]